MTPVSDRLTVSAERLWASLMDSAGFGATPRGRLCRLALSPEDPARSLSTIGIVEAYPGSRNTVPERVRLSSDLRHPSPDGLDRMEQALKAEIAGIELALGLDIALTPVWSSPPDVFQPAITAAIQKAVDRLGYSHQRTVSGAGHDSIYTARVAPTGMIFIACEQGISHNEAENITPDQAEAGANVLLHAVLNFDRETAA